MDNLYQIREKAKLEYHALLTQSFKELLETKHLYQNVKIDIEKLYESLKTSCSAYGMEGTLIFDGFKEYTLYPLDTSIGRRLPLTMMDSSTPKVVHINLPTIKVYCAICKRIEPFNPLSTDFTETQRAIEYSLFPEQVVYSMQSG